MKRKAQIEMEIGQPINIVHNNQKTTLIAQVDTNEDKSKCCEICWFDINGIECDNYICDLHHREDKTSVHFKQTKVVQLQ